eukprot:c23471_g1_i1 orf=110-1600(+)
MLAWMRIARSRWSDNSSRLPLSTSHLGFRFCSGVESGRQQQDVPTLKGELRRLFKLVHPDLYHNRPVEQATNQRSFQLLQEYLNAAKGHGNPQRFAYHFEFFVRQDADTENLRKVEVSLPPPQVRFHPQRGAEILSNTRMAFGNLLSAFGLSANVSGSLTSEEDHINLYDLFQQASEIQRRNEASGRGLEQQLLIVKNALRVGRGIKVSFRPPLSNLPFGEQREVLDKFAVAVDKSENVPLSGHSFLIGDCYGVDAIGNVWLNLDGDIQSWSKFLQKVDLKNAARNRQEAATRRLLEFKAAKLMEVEMIFTDDALAVKPGYSTFLNGIVEEAMRQGAVGAGKFSELPVRVIDPKEKLEIGCVEDVEKVGVSYWKVDRTLGYVSIPMGETLANVYSFIEQQGEAALQIRQKVKQSEERVEHVKMIARKKLRLRHLTFDKTLRIDQCLAACMRLIHYVPDLEKYTEGLSICLSNEHRLPQEGAKSSMHLKWNFNTSEF